MYAIRSYYGIDELRRRAEHARVLALREAEQRAQVRVARRAIVEQQPRLRRQPRHEPVPHHPAAGGEVEESVARNNFV